MALYKKLNYATGTLASGIADDAVEITLSAGHTITTDTGIDNNFIGVFFASTESSPYQDATREIVDAYRTDTNTFTITRAQEGTSAKAWSQDDNFMLIASAGVFNEYETELDGKVNLDQTTPQTIGATGSRLTKLWATDIEVTNAIAGSVTGNAGTVTNGVYTTSKLSALATTSSSELAGVISDETGSGSLVFGTSPILTTPNIGAATGTSLALEGTTLGMLSLKNTASTAYTRMLFDGTGTDFTQGVGNASAAIADLQNKFYIYDFTNSKTAFTIVPNTLAAKFYGSLEATNLSGTNTGDEVAALSAEINTGTDETKYVTPDALAGSNAFTKTVQQICVDFATELAVVEGVGYIVIPAECNGMNLISARADVITAGTNNASTFDIYNVTDSTTMLSSAISIASGATSGTGTVDTSHDDVATGDLIRIDCKTLSTTKPKGLIINLAFRLA